MRKTTMLTVAGIAFAMLLAAGVPKASAGVDIAIGIPLPGVAVYAPAPPVYYGPAYYPRTYYAPSYYYGGYGYRGYGPAYGGYYGGWGSRYYGGHRWYGGGHRHHRHCRH